MKVAYYSPLPPERSGVADYSALLLPALRRRIDLVVVQRGRRRRGRHADLSLYHVGNDPEAHGWIVDALRRRPGVVVLHDFVLHHLVAGITLGRGDGHAYLDAMERDAGLVGRLLAHGVLDRRLPPLWETRPADFPLAREVLDHATGLIVHSRYVEERVRELGFDGPVWRVPHPAWPVGDVEPEAWDGNPLIGCFGYLNASKRIPQLLEAFDRLHRDRPEARLLLVGAVAPRFELGRRLEALSPATRAAVVHEDYVPEGRLNALIARADICVSLRAPTMGETSGVVLRALSLGRPLVVSDVGWFAELPEALASKVPVDEHEVDRLTAALMRLATPPEGRRVVSQAAVDYARLEHGLEHVADLYAASLEEGAGGPRLRESLFGEVATAAAEVGIGPDDPLVGDLAARLREAGLVE